MKKVIFFAALLMGACNISFAGTPKGESTKTETATSVKTEAGDNLIWYKVTYDAGHMTGYIPSGTSPIYNGDQSGAEGLEECPTGDDFDCLRGFVTAPTLPSSASGTQQVKTDVRP